MSPEQVIGILSFGHFTIVKDQAMASFSGPLFDRKELPPRPRPTLPPALVHCIRFTKSGLPTARLSLQQVTGNDHWAQFVDACLGKGKTAANFGYAGPLTEAVLLGSVATRFPKTTLEWDGVGLRFKNVADANPYLRRRYRAGWEVKGL